VKAGFFISSPDDQIIKDLLGEMIMINKKLVSIDLSGKNSTFSNRGYKNPKLLVAVHHFPT
jgi:hypothetical protein